MQLLIDIGNTRIKWAFDSGSALLHTGEIVHRNKTSAVATEFVSQLNEKPEAVFALNVAGAELEDALQKAVGKQFGLPMQMVNTSGKCGAVTNGYTSIEQLGADRWAALVGAWHQCRRAVIVVDVGTAITVDLVAANGSHLGGIIVPGVDLMRMSLKSDTSDIGGFAGNSKGPVPGRDWYGRDTLSAVERGTLFCARAVIEQAIEEFAGEDGAPAVFITGGDAELVVPLISVPVEHRPHLVLEGLRLLVGGGS